MADPNWLNRTDGELNGCQDADRRAGYDSRAHYFTRVLDAPNTRINVECGACLVGGDPEPYRRPYAPSATGTDIYNAYKAHFVKHDNTVKAALSIPKNTKGQGGGGGSRGAGGSKGGSNLHSGFNPQLQGGGGGGPSEKCVTTLLLVLTTATDALGASALQVGQRLLDKSIQAYSIRCLSCKWAEVCQWFNLPERAKDWLYTAPSSDSGVELRYIVLNAQQMLEMAGLQSVQDETRLIKRLADYIQPIKPKYITSEPAFLLCVEKWQRMLLRQYSNGISPTVANENLEVYLAWLRNVHSE